jgi:hypothetical protein
VIVAIHQPNFLPWLGWFDKLARADVFVLLDDVQFPRSGHGEWMNRVRFLFHGEPAWATVPILRKGVQEIREVGVDDAQPWRRKLLKTFEASYRRAPAYEQAAGVMRDVLGLETNSLVELNEHGILRIASLLGLDTSKLVRSSTLGVSGSGSDLLAEITRLVGGNIYLSGGGAEEYQQEESYSSRGVELRFQSFEHPVYPQLGDGFVSGLSAIDALANCGVDGMRRLQWARST